MVSARSAEGIASGQWQAEWKKRQSNIDNRQKGDGRQATAMATRQSIFIWTIVDYRCTIRMDDGRWMIVDGGRWMVDGGWLAGRDGWRAGLEMSGVGLERNGCQWSVLWVEMEGVVPWRRRREEHSRTIPAIDQIHRRRTRSIREHTTNPKRAQQRPTSHLSCLGRHCFAYPLLACPLVGLSREIA